MGVCPRFATLPKPEFSKMLAVVVEVENQHSTRSFESLTGFQMYGY